MKNLFALIVFLFLALPAINVMAQAGKGTGKIGGRLLEPSTKEPVGFASLGLYTVKDSALVNSTSSDEGGKFLLENLPNGHYYLKISLVGYSPKKLSNLVISPAQPVLEVGTIMVPYSAKKISEVEIVAQKELVEYGLDKQVINVAKDITSTGGTAADALKNAPSVAVDIDGNVSVRGSGNVTVLVNGKNSGQSAQSILSQTPASAIESIEVITNPSAKYDAEGMGGIINIILKKERKPGMNGNVALNLGTYDNHNASVNLNYNVNKFNFFAGYDYQQQFRRGIYALDRATTAFNDITEQRETTYLEQRQTGRRKSQTHIPKIGFDYNLTKTQTITLSSKLFLNGWQETETVTNHFRNRTWPQDSYGYRLGETENNINVIDYAASYRKTFDKKRQELTASAVLTDISGRFDRFYDQLHANPEWDRLGRERAENFLQEFKVKPFFAQVDYVHPIGEKGKIETGAKRSQRVLSTTFTGEIYDFEKEKFQFDPLTSNSFGYGEYVNAAYANYGNTFKKFSYQAGLRAEQTNIIVTDKGNGRAYKNPYFNFFPSAFLTQEINEDLKVQLNYSRRINRPNYEALNPFVNYSDPYNIWFGNPYLRPEYVDAYEASGIKFWKTGSLTTTGFYRNVHNLIQQVRSVDSLNPTVAYNNYVNLKDATSYGLEISGSQALAKWWKISGNVSTFNYKISGRPLGLEAASSRFSWLSRLNSNFNLPNGLTVQLSLNYRSPQALAQGTRAAIYNTDVSVKKEVLKKRGAVTLRVSDVFNTLQWDTYISSPDLTYDLHTKRQTRIAILGFSYRFGNDQEKRRRPETNTLDGMF